MKNSPFHWQGKPSIFSSDLNFRNSTGVVATSKAVKQTIRLRGSKILTPLQEQQLITHSKAKRSHHAK